VSVVNRHNMRDNQFVSEAAIFLVKRALRRGLSRESSIQRFTNLHWIEISAALRILESKGAVVPRGAVRRWWGTAEDTYCYRERRNRELITPRKNRGKGRRDMTMYSLRNGFFESIGGGAVGWEGLKFVKEKRRRRQ
jgi:hypothetical protein